MQEETAKESSFWSIFKDYYGRYYSENVVFVSINATCIFIALLTSLTDATLALLGVFMHVDLNSAMVALTSSNTALIGVMQGIGAYKKNQATKLVFNKELKKKEIEKGKIENEK